MGKLRAERNFDKRRRGHDHAAAKREATSRARIHFYNQGRFNPVCKTSGSMDLPEGEGSAVFSTSSKQAQARWVYFGVTWKIGRTDRRLARKGAQG